MTVDETTYAFANARSIQRQRLDALQAVLDSGSFRLLSDRGVGPGWRCLEVGGGGGSVAAWLGQRVAPGGSVLATDLDVTLLQEVADPHFEVRVHNVLTDPLEAGAFDLVHARLLLAWLTEPQAGLQRMTAALKPGGLLLAEEMDFVSLIPDPGLDPSRQATFARVADAHIAVLAEHHAFDPFCGRQLVRYLEGAGLVGVGCEGRVSMWRGGEPSGTLLELTLVQLREEMIAGGLASAEEIDEVIELCRDPRLSFMSQTTMAAWGFRSEEV